MRYWNDLNHLSCDIENAILLNCSNICNDNDHMHCVNGIMIERVVKHFKKGKNDGYDGLSSDYIINRITF